MQSGAQTKRVSAVAKAAEDWKKTARARRKAPANHQPARGTASNMNSRDRLLEVAIGLFATHGFDSVTTSAVAAAVGLTQSMVHYHFQSKTNLWRAAIVRLMHSRGAVFPLGELDLRDLDPLSRLKVLTRRFMMASASEPHMSRIAMHEALQHSPRLTWLIERYVGVTYRLFDSTVREAIEQGRLKRLPIGDVTTLILTAGAIPFVADAWVEDLYGYSQTDTDRVDSYISTAMTVLFTGLAAEPDVAVVERPAAAPTQAQQPAAGFAPTPEVTSDTPRR